MNGRRGFTNMEVLVIVGAVAVLFAGVVLAIDPARRLSQARDAARRRDAREVLAALVAKAQEGGAPAAVDADPSTYQVLGTDRSGCDRACGQVTAVPACVDLSGPLGQMPIDPRTGSAGNTRYAVNAAASGAFEVVACDPELAATISVRR